VSTAIKGTRSIETETNLAKRSSSECERLHCISANKPSLFNSNPNPEKNRKADIRITEMAEKQGVYFVQITTSA
jgi:hypothetical protein